MRASALFTWPALYLSDLGEKKHNMFPNIKIERLKLVTKVIKRKWCKQKIPHQAFGY